MMRLYAGLIVNPLERDPRLTYIPDGCLIVSHEGKIEFVGALTDATVRFNNTQIQRFDNALIMPGFVDTHVHLPQYQAAAVGKGELLRWLNDYVFPLEARFVDETYAHEHSLQFFQDALSVGTTTMSVYCSSHKRATEVAFEAAAETGVRVCMGKTMMDGGAPNNIVFSAEQNITDSLAIARDWHGRDDGRLQYTLTPRFAGSCSKELLASTGEVARAEGLRIQTHIAENPEELRFIASLFPDAASYTDVYDKAGLLSDKTILAHCVYLSAQERDVLRRHDCALAHCPSSNRFLQSGVMALRRSMSEGFRIGLGSDIAGGYSLSIPNEAREAAESSKTWNIFHRDEETTPVGAEEALWLATLGGARALGLDDVIGNFTVGKDADFVVVSLQNVLPRESLFSGFSDLMARFVYAGASAQILRTYVRGREVYKAPFS